MTIPPLSSTSGARWRLSHRFDTRALPLADRHYSRRKVGSPQFVKPGSNIVLLTEAADALWVTSWPQGEYVRHAWPGAWECSFFRNEGDVLSSELITEAVAITRWHYGEPPAEGIITFINPKKVRRKRDPGRCYLRAGWKRIGETQGGLIVLGQEPDAMPESLEPIGAQMEFAA